jgi:hypothetical protein
VVLRLDDFTVSYMRDGKRHVPGRLQAAIALIERLRDFPSVQLDAHVTKKGGAALLGHETFGDRAHERLELKAINKNHGRRSSNIREWGQELLNEFALAGFTALDEKSRGKLIDQAQASLAQHLKAILEEEPLTVRLKGRSAESVIHEILAQAEDKGKSGEVAQYLVGAKLELRFGRDLPLHGANLGDRRSHSDMRARAGDFEFEDAVIEVAVGLPDEKHIQQIVTAAEDGDSEVYLLTRADRVVTWQNELKESGADMKRVIVRSVEAFVGQNMSEMGEFSAKGRAENLTALFSRYNNRWIAHFGPPGIRIILA